MNNPHVCLEVAGCLRQAGFEIAVVYGLVTQSGGVMVTLDDASLADQPYFQFGQGKHVPIITAANSQPAEELRKHIKDKWPFLLFD